MSSEPVILFTAFEPSGDEHAAPVIAALRRLEPGLRICAMGGPRMEAAGAEVLEQTTGRSVMGVGAVGQALAHRARLKRLQVWIDRHAVVLHVPTDSPAANWAICRMVKRRWGGRQVTDATGRPRRAGRVVHLVAPQVWAWASWRVRRLRRWSDHVLCLLPFEPGWFAERGVEATFIGHPLFDEPLEPRPLGKPAAVGGPRLAMLPGSREAEVRRNWPVMQQVFERLRERFADLGAIVAAADERGEQVLRESLGGAAGGVAVVRGRMADVVAEADAVLSVSGTATLHVARQLKPMVVVYRVNALAWHAAGRWLMNTGTFTLPNLVAGGGPHRDRSRHVVPEFVPFLGSAGEVRSVTDAVATLLSDAGQRERQVAALRQVAGPFEGRSASETAATTVLNLLADADRAR